MDSYGGVRKRKTAGLGCGLLAPYLSTNGFTRCFLTDCLARDFATNGLAALSRTALRTAFRRTFLRTTFRATLRRTALRTTLRRTFLRTALRTNAAATAFFAAFLRAFFDCHRWYVFLSLVNKRPGLLPSLYSISGVNASFCRGRRTHRRASEWTRAPRCGCLDPWFSAFVEHLGRARCARSGGVRRASGASRRRQLECAGRAVSHGIARRRRRAAARRTRYRASRVDRSFDGRIRRAGLRADVYGACDAASRCTPSRLRADTPKEAAARRELAERVERAASIEPVIEGLPRLFAPATLTERPRVVERGLRDRARHLAGRGGSRAARHGDAFLVGRFRRGSRRCRW